MRYIEIKATKQRLFITEQELNTMLALKPEIWAEALQRGKTITRVQQAEIRNKCPQT
jgi:hypothetical protein